MDTRFIDIHSHVNDSRFEADLLETLARMREASVSSIVVGTDHSMSEKAVHLATEYPDLWATVGLHPTDNHKEEFDLVVYETLASHPRVVAIGECGLDYHWPAHDGWPTGEREEKERQRVLFVKQIALAEQLEKPLMIHGRPTQGSMDAYEDILDILKDFPTIRGDVHFFVGDPVIAKRFLDVGFFLSFTGVLTFAKEYDETIRYAPLDRIMAETDAPYVAPALYRGKRNEPAYVTEVYAAIARIRGEDPEVVRNALVANARQLFDLR